MLSHIVLFWLNENISVSQRSDYRKGLETLGTIDCTKGVYIGTPAETGDRPVIDKTYDFAITVLFESIQDHNTYQTHPVHQEFLKQFGRLCKNLRVYDYE